MRVLYVGDLSPGGTCALRLAAMRRIGLDVQGFDTAPAEAAGGPIVRRLRVRLVIGPTVDRLNAALLAASHALRPDLIWFDKPCFVQTSTLEALRAQGAMLVSYICDNPFGRSGSVGWRLVRRTIPLFDLTVVPRLSSVTDFSRRGAPRVMMVPFAFDPEADVPVFPAVAKSVPVSFVGSPYDDRPRQLRELAGRGISLLVRGPRWRRSLLFPVPNLTLESAVWGPAYREALRRSAVALSFVTHGNDDPYGHKAFEITACGTFLLAERTDGHVAHWQEGKEAEFFQSMAEAADKARFYLREAAAREAVARAGCLRTWTSGYSNDERLAGVFSEIDGALGVRLRAAADSYMVHRRATLGIDAAVRTVPVGGAMP